MTWHASLEIDYSREADRTVARFRHTGPLRILQSLYPEGDGICHNVIVHPPGGLVGGDTLDLKLAVATGAHALVTTPGATRFYRSDGLLARQQTRICLAGGARFEWLPLETICYSGCLAENRLTLQLAAGSELIGWDLTALGLPGAKQPFADGQLCQHIELPGVWLERARIAAADTRLLQGGPGLAGHACFASLFFVAGERLSRPRREQALDTARSIVERHPLRTSVGATSPDAQVVVVRVLAPQVEPAMHLLRQVRDAWRRELWSLAPLAPRVWST